MKLIYTLPFLLLLFMAKAQNTPIPGPVESSKAWIDLDYVGDNHIGHKLDIFLPKEGKGPFPVIVTVYGSAWFSNSSKSQCFLNDFGQTLLRNGYAVVSVNHRSSRDAIWPAQIHDIKAAIRYIRANADQFSLDTRFLGISGYSSGGHLSTMAGVTSGLEEFVLGGLEISLDNKIGKHPEMDSSVDAVVDWFGPTDFLIMDSCGSSFSHDGADSPESTLVGGPIQENKAKVALANPISYVKKENPPMLIFHGTADPLVPHCESEKLYEAQQKAGAVSRLVIVPEGGHGPGVMIEKYYDEMVAFFNQQKSKNLTR
ncbi:esterase [Jiulongibacter sediminis]|uniref:Esterase n=2 Tax=Jiulongibacter sediminis TaxID=1605367 RepID=A0A0P7BYW4_9BACT|nr:esterase [Jiulongibacter sediminis]TBX21672.1 esterase [Jiulongibacter sediminis]